MLFQKRPAGIGNRNDGPAPARETSRHKTAAISFLPDGKARTGRAPGIHHFEIVAIFARNPRHEIDQQRVHGVRQASSGSASFSWRSYHSSHARQSRNSIRHLSGRSVRRLQNRARHLPYVTGSARFQAHPPPLLCSFGGHVRRFVRRSALREGGSETEAEQSNAPLTRGASGDARSQCYAASRSNAFRIALAISVVPSCVMPGCMMSAVRKPCASTRSTAASRSLASSARAKE